MNNRNSTLIIIILILLMVLSLFMLSRDNIDEEVYHKKYVPINELGDLNDYFVSNIIEFNGMIINSYLENDTLDNIDVLTNKNKIIFTFKNILKDENNYNKFLVLDKKTLNTSDKDPKSKDVYSYITTSDFKNYYTSLFNEDFNIDDRDKSPSNNEFDMYNMYLYYKNNDTPYKIDSIISTKNTIDDNYIITSEVVINLNKELSEKLKKDKVEAIIKYTYLENDVVKLISFKTKTSN